MIKSGTLIKRRPCGTIILLLKKEFYNTMGDRWLFVRLNTGSKDWTYEHHILNKELYEVLA